MTRTNSHRPHTIAAAAAVGLPLSLQIACRGYDEAMALSIGQPVRFAPEAVDQVHRDG